MGPKSLFSGLALALAASVGVACASNEDSTEAGSGAMSAGADATSSRADGGAPAIATLHVSGGALDVVEVVAVKDAEPMADDGTAGAPRARLVFSNQTGICNRLDQGYVLGSGEKVVSVWVGSESFVQGKAALGGANQSAGGCSLLDQSRLCSVDGTSRPIRGTGTLDLKSVGASVAGSVDVTVDRLHLTGSFVAKSCPAGKQTLGSAICKDAQGKSTTDVGGGPDYAASDAGSPDPSPTASR